MLTSMDQQAAFELDVNAVRQTASSREVRRQRCPSIRRSAAFSSSVTGTSTKSRSSSLSRQPRQVSRTTQKDKPRDKIRRPKHAMEEKIAPLTSTDDPLLSSNTLDRINQHKSIISELRPARRKIKWNQNISDWERKPVDQPKFEDLQMHDLQGMRIQAIVTSPPSSAADTSTTAANLHKSFSKLDIYDEITQNPGEHVDEIEDCIERCFKSIRRAKRETRTNQRKCQELQQLCAEARQELLQLPVPPRQQALRQAQQQMESTKKHLQDKQVELDEQIGMLRMQHSRLAADIAMSRELLDDDDKNEAIEMLHASLRLDADTEADFHSSSSRDESIPAALPNRTTGSRTARIASARSASLSSPSVSMGEFELDIKQRKPATPAAA